jgi:hypothetical protein
VIAVQLGALAVLLLLPDMLHEAAHDCGGQQAPAGKVSTASYCTSLTHPHMAHGAMRWFESCRARSYQQLQTTYMAANALPGQPLHAFAVRIKCIAGQLTHQHGHAQADLPALPLRHQHPAVRTVAHVTGVTQPVALLCLQPSTWPMLLQHILPQALHTRPPEGHLCPLLLAGMEPAALQASRWL